MTLPHEGIKYHKQIKIDFGEIDVFHAGSLLLDLDRSLLQANYTRHRIEYEFVGAASDIPSIGPCPASDRPHA